MQNRLAQNLREEQEPDTPDTMNTEKEDEKWEETDLTNEPLGRETKRKQSNENDTGRRRKRRPTNYDKYIDTPLSDDNALAWWTQRRIDTIYQQARDDNNTQIIELIQEERQRANR